MFTLEGYLGNTWLSCDEWRNKKTIEEARELFFKANKFFLCPVRIIDSESRNIVEEWNKDF